MKKNYILKSICISVAVVLTVGIGSFVRASNNREEQVVKTMVENREIPDEENVQDTVEELNKQDAKEETNSEAVKTEILNAKLDVVETKPNNVANKKIEIEEDKNKVKTENIKEEQKAVVKVEELKDKELTTKSGYIRDYYEECGELYILFDDADFYLSDQARKEYYKDGNTEEPMEEWGNDYYIRNNDESTKVYKVANGSNLQLLSFEVDEGNSNDLVSVTADKLKQKIDKYKNNKMTERGLLVYIDESDNVIFGMRSIFTP